MGSKSEGRFVIVFEVGELEIEGDFSSDGGEGGVERDEPFETRTQSPLALRSQKRS